MSGSRVVQVNKTEVVILDNPRDHEFIIDATARNGGHGWQVPLRNMSPNDLRALADIMEAEGVSPDHTLADHRLHVRGIDL